ncbi:SpoIIE family protein phosphatase [Streptomyces sp. NPDC007901]|uniref:ATP-binding SpoIIE family protein phosphatase n=1 Tax=Streptomyces sp. NPDC007901 TaxID=3364785 RepID=UPI0036EDC951
MGIDVDIFLRDLARGLRPRTDELTDAVLREISPDVPWVWEHEDTAVVASAAVSQHVTAALDINEYSLDAASLAVPPADIEAARVLARHGVPLNDFLRAFRLGHASLHRIVCEEVSRLAADDGLAGEAVITLNVQSFTYMDRVAEEAVVAYQEERDRWLQRRLVVVNEASRRVGATLDITRTAQELADVGTEYLADLVTVDLLDALLPGRAPRPATGRLVLRRIAQRSALDDCPDSAFPLGQAHTFPEGSEPGRVLATGQPIRYGITAAQVPQWMAQSAVQREALRAFGVHSMLLVPLWAHGGPLGLVQFFRHRTTAAFDEEELLLAQEIASRAAIHLDNAKRYTRERDTALTLQRSLLPEPVAEQCAVGTASRYLPAESGVGGDWYDVIPLSGARVALVVGDVVGRGLHACATMGRLRTAVRTLADIDLMPDELLTHLDDVVIRLQREETRGSDEMSATCLYAVYDPVSRLCSVASAGHPLPALVSPATVGTGAAARAVVFPELPIGPPLGLGGLPFETAQFEVTEGSLLVLYTDGLIESLIRDVDAGLALLADVLARAPASLEETCDALLSALLPTSPADDVALLVARTRTLDAGHVATWDLPSDPAVVATARERASDSLAAWGLEELDFATKLMVSELVTNAIRYGKDPVQLRMIYQSTLMCEVADGSSTAPHLRRARVYDEGGRGLLLVAQLAERWGTRHGREGKVIWAEQALPAAARGGVARAPQ